MKYSDYMSKTQICAERMKRLREERGLTMDELAEEIGMSPCSVYYYEHSKHVPNIITLIKYAMYFGVSTDYLLGMEEDAEIIAATLRAMMVDRPQETRLSKLLRQYPKAKAECIKEHYSCPAYLGYSCPNPKVRCKDCWDTPIEEEEQE